MTSRESRSNDFEIVAERQPADPDKNRLEAKLGKIAKAKLPPVLEKKQRRLKIATADE